MAEAEIRRVEHRARKGNVHLYLLQKFRGERPGNAPVVFFVHGSSMSSTPTFDLQVPGRPGSSAMDWFAERGFDAWCADMEGYGRSDKHRDINSDISTGADDCVAAALYIRKVRPQAPLFVYGVSSGALRAALFAQRHPDLVDRLALDALVWTGADSPTLAQRRKKLAEFQASNRRAIDKAFIRSIFERDHPGAAEPGVVDRLADAVTALDDSVPTGTYVDMCSKLPLVYPESIMAPTLVMRGQWDGIASEADVVEFFRRLPNPEKQFAMLPGIAHASFQEKNYLLVYHILWSFFSQPAPVYRG